MSSISNISSDSVENESPHRQSLREQFRIICEKRSLEPLPRKPSPVFVDIKDLKVGIIGAGMAGLYSGLLLKSQRVDFHIYEANPERVGGRIYTHRFNAEKDQYFEAGAMRLPKTHQEPVFKLIGYVNEENKNNTDYLVELLDYVINTENNYVFVNGVRNKDGSTMTLREAREDPAKLNFPVEGQDKHRIADELLHDVLKEYIELVDNGGLESLVKSYDSYSMRSFLTLVKKWSHTKVDYVETMTSQTQQFDHSFVEIVMEYMNFSETKWKTIKDGMSRLPEACRKIIGDENISLGAHVHEIAEVAGNKVTVSYKKGNGIYHDTFDAIILAIPPAVIRFMDRPLWPADKEIALRSVHFEPLYKIGLRFKSRFWEKVSKPSYGGQSITDLPGRWIVYPSYGLHDDGDGVLLCYSWMGDALKWLPKSTEEQEQLALRDLSNLYGEEMIKNQFLESKAVSWATEWSLGDAHFLPGQFENFFKVLQVPENNIHFAGEHLSVHHTWILGAIDSALNTCRKLLSKPNLGWLEPKA